MENNDLNWETNAERVSIPKGERMEEKTFREECLSRVMKLEPANRDETWTRYARTFCQLFYKTYPIKKPSGGERWVEEPHSTLMQFQRSLLYKFEQFPLHPAAHGMGEKGYVENARIHQDSTEILSVDLKEFYKNCTLARLEKTIKDQKLLGLTQEKALFLFYAPRGVEKKEDIFLATGSPLSPLMANHAVTELDRDLQKAANTHQAKYSRYLDDMTFSFKRQLSKEERCAFYRLILERVMCDGWPINWKKTKWFDSNRDAIVVTGVDLRNKPKVTRRYIQHQVRPLINNMVVELTDYRPGGGEVLYLAERIKTPIDILEHMGERGQGPKLQGILNYIKQVSPEQYNSVAEYALKRLNRMNAKAYFPEHKNLTSCPQYQTALARLIEAGIPDNIAKIVIRHLGHSRVTDVSTEQSDSSS